MLIALLTACSEYEVSAKPDHGAGDERVPLGPDDEGEGDTGDDVGGGTVTEPDDDETTDEPCVGTKRVRIGLAADDYWEGWVDGVAFGSAEHWWEAAWYEMELSCGEHVVSVYATDLHQAISGFIAVFEVDGEPTRVTGDGTWRVTPGHGERGWQDPGFDDSGWDMGTSCETSSATGWWGGNPADLLSMGAWWIWSGECLELGDASFRTTVVVE
ncbi:MAG: hypothetical protein ACOZNI_19730 [Myxococcota bacterium]